MTIRSGYVIDHPNYYEIDFELLKQNCAGLTGFTFCNLIMDGDGQIMLTYLGPYEFTQTEIDIVNAALEQNVPPVLETPVQTQAEIIANLQAQVAYLLTQLS